MNHHKRYYNKRVRCLKLAINDIVLVRVKAFGNDRKVANKWEQTPYREVEQIPNRPVFKVQNLEDYMKICTLYRNMLYPLKTVQEDSTDDVIIKNVNVQLQDTNNLMLKHFESS